MQKNERFYFRIVVGIDARKKPITLRFTARNPEVLSVTAMPRILERMNENIPMPSFRNTGDFVSPGGKKTRAHHQVRVPRNNRINELLYFPGKMLTVTVKLHRDVKMVPLSIKIPCLHRASDSRG